MTTYAVTGATGPFGHRAVEALLERGAAPGDVIALVRTPARAADLAQRGVLVREADYDRPETLAAALAGVDELLLVSGNAVGQRVRQHTAVLEAARAAGVRRVVYTSAPKADDTQLALAPEHRATEEALRASGLAWTVLRNGWYAENYTSQVPVWRSTGALLGAAGEGRVTAAPRDELAEAAAAALLGDSHDGRTYELGGPATAFAAIAEAASDAQHPVRYQPLSEEGFAAALREHAGMDEAVAAFVASLDASIARGELETGAQDLERLLGRPPTPLVASVRAAARGDA